MQAEPFAVGPRCLAIVPSEDLGIIACPAKAARSGNLRNGIVGLREQSQTLLAIVTKCWDKLVVASRPPYNTVRR